MEGPSAVARGAEEKLRAPRKTAPPRRRAGAARGWKAEARCAETRERAAGAAERRSDAPALQAKASISGGADSLRVLGAGGKLRSGERGGGLCRELRCSLGPAVVVPLFVCPLISHYPYTWQPCEAVISLG